MQYNLKQHLQNINLPSTQPIEDDMQDKGCKQEYKLEEDVIQDLFNASLFQQEGLNPQIKQEQVTITQQENLEDHLKALLRQQFRQQINMRGSFASQDKQQAIQVNYTFFEFANNQIGYTANLKPTRFFLWEKYIPEEHCVIIQAFNQDNLNNQYQLTIRLEFLKENDSHYDELLFLFIEHIFRQNPNIEVYFLEFGKVLRTYFLVYKLQIKVFTKAILMINKLDKLSFHLTIVMAGLDLQDAYNQKELNELIDNNNNILFFYHIFNENMKIVLKPFFTKDKIEEVQTFSLVDQFIIHVIQSYSQLQSHQNQIVHIQNLVKLQIKAKEQQKILRIYFKDPNDWLSINGFFQILLNIINSFKFGFDNKSIAQEQVFLQMILKHIKVLLLNKNLFQETQRQTQKRNRSQLIQGAQFIVNNNDSDFYTIPGNRHFPEKRLNCARCKVCRRKAAVQEIIKVHKTKYRCKGCFIMYKRNINLCITPCFEEFHSHPDCYLVRNKPLKLSITGLHSKQINKNQSLH